MENGCSGLQPRFVLDGGEIALENAVASRRRRVKQEAEWLNSLNYETRCKPDKRGQKERPRRLTRRPSEEIYLTTVPGREEMEQEADEKEGKTEGWHSFKTS